MSGLEGPAGATELEERIRFHILSNQPPGTAAAITFARVPDDPAWPPDVLSFPEVLELARRLREIVTGARPLDPNDFALPEENGPTADLFDMADLEGRAQDALTVVSGAETVLENALSVFPVDDSITDPVPSLNALRQALLAALAVGIAGAIPVAAAGNDATTYQALIPQARSVLNELKARKKNAEESFQHFQTLDAAGGEPEVNGPLMRDYLADTIRYVFGAAFRVLPRFQPRKVSEINLALNHPGLLDGDDPDAPLRWFQQVSRVSPALNRYEMAAFLAETISGQAFDLRVGQLPFQDPDRWLGLPLATDQELAPGRVSLVTHLPLGFNDGASFTGLFLDYLQERIPNPNERTGISLHFNQPGSRAPQTILLAVPPRRQDTWTWPDLVQTVYDTLDLAKIRAVDTETLTGLGHYLPGIFLSYNPDDDTVSTDMLVYTHSVLEENI
jgi:hypothetical protein